MPLLRSLIGSGAVICLVACAPTAAPLEGTYDLQRVRGKTLPVDLKPIGEPRYGGYYERVYSGGLVLYPDATYRIITCGEMLDGTGHVSNSSSREEGGRYTSRGRRVYLEFPVLDMPRVDTLQSEVRRGVLELRRGDDVFTYRRGQPRFNPLASDCPH